MQEEDEGRRKAIIGLALGFLLSFALVSVIMRSPANNQESQNQQIKEVL